MEEGGRKDENASEDAKVDAVGCMENDVGVDIVEGGLGNLDGRSTVVSHGGLKTTRAETLM